MPIGDMKRPGIVVGMGAEARVARRFGFPVATPGNAEALLADGADGLISFGIAGGLVPGLKPGTLVVATEVITDKAWLEGGFITTVQQRGAAVIKARGLSSAASAANAALAATRNR